MQGIPAIPGLPSLPQSPFLTRDMLKFGRASKIEIRITSLANQAATLYIRGWTREGTFTFRHTTVYDGQQHQNTYRLDDFPIMLTVEDFDLSFNVGACYVIVDLLLNSTVVGVLLSGSVHQATALGWPTATNEQPMPGKGEIAVVTGSDPAANVEASVSSDSLQAWRVIGGSVRLVTDANAANRRVHIKATNSGKVVAEAFASIDQVASTTIDYRFGMFGTIPDETDNNVTLISWPHDIWIRESVDSISTATLNRQATDNFGAMSILVEKFFRSNA